MPRRILAPVLIAALAAAAQGARAEDGPPPFPGVAAEARRASAPEAVRPAPDTAPAEAAPAVPGEASVPAGGSRLLRALAEGPRRDDTWAEDRVPVMATEGCPRALLRRLLAGVAGEADALSALGIEREILTLCRERQEILAGLFEAEAALRELRTPPVAQAAAPDSKVQAGAASAVPAAAPSPLRAAPAAEDKAMEAEPQAPARVPPRYGWFSIVGVAGALRAGVTDGTEVWFVREGDPLPGGARVAAIAVRPPGVRVRGGNGNGNDALLPYRAWPGGAP